MEMSEKVDEIKDYFKLKDFSHVVTRIFTKFKRFVNYYFLNYFQHFLKNSLLISVKRSLENSI